MPAQFKTLRLDSAILVRLPYLISQKVEASKKCLEPPTRSKGAGRGYRPHESPPRIGIDQKAEQSPNPAQRHGLMRLIIRFGSLADIA
jgi:hypothetical protein